MTSILRQVPTLPRTMQYLYVNTSVPLTVDAPLDASTVGAIYIVPGTVGPSDQIQTLDISAGATGDIYQAALVAGTVYRDTGRALYVYDIVGAGGTMLCVFREATVVNGSGTEGMAPLVAGSNPIWIKTWAANGAVYVTRTG